MTSDLLLPIRAFWGGKARGPGNLPDFDEPRLDAPNGSHATLLDGTAQSGYPKTTG